MTNYAWPTLHGFQRAGIALVVIGALTTPSTTLAAQPDNVTPNQAAVSIKRVMPALVAPNQPGEIGKQTYDPTLQQDGDLLSAEGAMVNSTVGLEAASGFGLPGPGGGAIHVVPVGVDGDADEGKLLAGGDGILYANTDPYADTLVRPTAVGIETFTHIRGPNAPEQYSWRVDVPGDARMILRSGGVEILDAASNVVGQVLPPWARDASRRSVPVKFTVAGQSLIMKVAHRTGKHAYPIIADPWWNPATWGWDPRTRRKIATCVDQAWTWGNRGKLLASIGHQGSFVVERFGGVIGGAGGCRQPICGQRARCDGSSAS